jgi:hypothetical protein
MDTLAPFFIDRDGSIGVVAWLERNWDLLSERVWERATEETLTEPEYFDSDIGPLLYAINPEREKLNQDR